MEYHYTSERNAQIIVYLLKQYGIKKVVASPGATNVPIVASMQQDAFFEMYSAADERSAAYIACGLAEESGEPVVLSCTGATASRNYMPGLTEAFYRKLPIIAVTSTCSISKIGHLMAQCIDRTQIPHDIALESVHINKIQNADEEHDAILLVNKAINGIYRRGGGPVHINIATSYSRDFSIEELPKAKVIRRYDHNSQLPALPQGKICIFIGSHKRFTEEETAVIDQFCKENDALAFCDHTSGFKGEYRFLGALVAQQANVKSELFISDLCIHLGEVSGDYPCLRVLKKAKNVWRVSEDGEYRDFGNHLSSVFEMKEIDFFKRYLKNNNVVKNTFINKCKNEYSNLRALITSDTIPFSNAWTAWHLSGMLPDDSSLYLSILNSLRCWNFFEISNTISSSSNVGGFGIDGCVSTMIGASLASPNKLFFGVFGDLALFYDMNVLLNRHVGNNLRVLLVNNGKGAEFRLYSHVAAKVGEDADKFIAAAGHYGNKSNELIKNLAQNAGFEYMQACDKYSFLAQCEKFVNPTIEKSIIFEVFTNSDDESDAIYALSHLNSSIKEQAVEKAKSIITGMLGDSALKKVKKIIK